MHVQKNIFDNTMMDTDQTKDNDKVRLDFAEYYRLLELYLQKIKRWPFMKLKVNYTLSSAHKQTVYKWI